MNTQCRLEAGAPDHTEDRRSTQSRLEAGAPAAGFRVVGLDVAGPALDYAVSRGIEVIREPFLEHDFGGRQFDAITLWAVLEHLVQPREFLAKAAGLLRAGGFCFVLVPNLNSLAIRLLGRKYRYVMPDHVNYFTAATLRELGGSISPLAVVQISSMHFNPLVIWQDWRGSGELVPEEERARLLQQTTALKQSPRWKPARWLYDGVEKMLGALLLADNLVMVLKK